MINRTKTVSEIAFTQSGRVGYFVLWLLGAPAGLLILLWVFLGNNIFGKG